MHGWLPYLHLRDLLVVVLVGAGAFVTYAVGRGLRATLLRDESIEPPALGTARRSQDGGLATVRPMAIRPRSRTTQATSPRTPEWGVSDNRETDDLPLDPAERKSA